ncbi:MULTISPECIES: SycD/LcrH family type III secretion system chaperone [Vibrio]|uniref:Chaperone protein SicA n=2 Tax=Vibrio TaxID=662 RepID=A0A5P9CND5_9VIBR|nr:MULTISPECIES: SycD/LcrH family type III secretion system chaperone [Vibrio]QFT27730.1 Chaperone protein SicA [Vibrio aquimaris]GLT17822.1 CesD/SycD/LcrH family type III secretion system chaperone [Vibrio zhanjiangensis]
MEEESVKNCTQEDILQYLKGGGTLAELHEFSPTTLETVYHAAFNYYNMGSYEEAVSIFQFLCAFDHFKVKYFIGLGSCLFMLKQYDSAIETYSYAGLIDGDDPRPPYYSAKCHLMLGKHQAAASGFFAASQMSGNYNQFDDICADAKRRYKKMNLIEG